MDSETLKVASAGTVGTISTLAGWAELLNPIITASIGLLSVIYICSKIYFLWKNHGKTGEDE